MFSDDFREPHVQKDRARKHHARRSFVMMQERTPRGRRPFALMKFGAAHRGGGIAQAAFHPEDSKLAYGEI